MAKKKAAPRTEFALPAKKMFPLNTTGRVDAAPGLAGVAQKAGTITPAEAAKVRKAAAAKRKKA